MKIGALWLVALSTAVFAILARDPVRAAEFCPARLAHVSSVVGSPGIIAVSLTAPSPRNVTGQFLLETDHGWYRAPFPPVRLDKRERGLESPPIYLSFDPSARLTNIWISQAAADDSEWGPHGVVTCAPDPQRREAGMKVKPESQAMTIAAITISPPFTYECTTPFAEAKVDPDVMDRDDIYAPGQFAEARVDLDNTGKPVDVIGIDASGDDFTLRKELENRVKHMRFTPAIAYCRPVPSSYMLREGAAP